MNLQEFFKLNPRAAIAFSGGVDSSYLLYAACKYGAQAKAYYVKSAFQPEFELEDAKRLAENVGADMEIIYEDVLKADEVAANPKERCYFCKHRIFSRILGAAAEDGFTTVLDGTNASDDAADRPGMKALSELKVLSPLRECGLTKNDIRALSKEAGLFTWDKPAYACLATRIQTGERITEDKLRAVEESEKFLFGLGFSDFRVRTADGRAKLQVKKDQMELAVSKRTDIINELGKYFSEVTLDLKAR